VGLSESLLTYLHRKPDAKWWRDAPYPEPLLKHLRGDNDEDAGRFRVHPARRKVRFFAAACCRRVGHLVRFSQLVELIRMVEDYADRRLGLEELLVATRQAREVVGEEEVAEPSQLDRLLREVHRLADYELLRPTPADRLAHAACLKAADGNSAEAVDCWKHAAEAAANAGADLAAELAFQADLLRDLFGNPFTPTAFEPAWRTSPVMDLAHSINQSGDFSLLPILADALQEAGCEDPEILAHCRESLVHTRGCWVVDAVIGL
jgi:hypothetical protein